MSSLSTTESAARVGVWLIGARGSVSTTAIVGASALAARLVSPIGLVTELSPLRETSLPSFDSMVFGGHDLVETPLVKRAESLVGGGVFPPSLLEATRSVLQRAEAEIRPGYGGESSQPSEPVQSGEPSQPREPSQASEGGERGEGGEWNASAAVTIERLRADIVDFARRNEIADLVVVNLSSVERVASPYVLEMPLADVVGQAQSSTVPASILYAVAAIEAGASYIDFTPSAALLSRAVLEAAAQARVPIAGRDGKTGETLVKSALAPMFARRNLRVRSWAGTNLLGGGDGATLAVPDVAVAKLSSKAASLESVLGYPVTAPLHIDYVEDAGEWKTAWDHIAFEGFMGTRMTMQFTWHGCDSALAAPLVLDLVRLLIFAHRRHEYGEISQLGFFFKDPIGSDQHALDAQFHELCSWVLRTSA